MSEITVKLSKYLRSGIGSRSTREVAKEIGISHATISRVCNGGIPDLMTFKKICEWMSINPSYLLGLSEIITKENLGAGSPDLGDGQINDHILDLIDEHIFMIVKIQEAIMGCPGWEISKIALTGPKIIAHKIRRMYREKLNSEGGGSDG